MTLDRERLIPRNDPDHPAIRRRALAARAATLADYVHERLTVMAEGAEELGVPVPLELATFPQVLQEWADTVERTQP